MLAAGAALVGCAAPLGSTTAPIFGGAATTDHPEVGWVIFDDSFACSAVLVGARRALTAAHCVYAFENDPGALGVVFAAGTERPAPEAAVGVTELFLAPEYTTNPVNDLAVLELAGDAPVAPVPYRTAALSDDDLDTPVRLVGFGMQSADDEGADRSRRVGEVTLGEVEPVAVRWFSEDAGLCYGDSGGAVYLDGPGGWELAAVATEGDAQCATRGAGVRTDAFADWLANPGTTSGDDDDVAWPDDDDDDAGPPTQGCPAQAAWLPLLLPALGLRRRNLQEP